MSKKVVVTGASGHIGGNLVRSLIEQDREVCCLVRRDRRAIDGLNVEIAPLDLFDVDALAASFKGAGTVFHLAALISIVGAVGGKVERTNVEGARNIAEACLKAGVDRLVHFSSIHAYQQKPLDVPVTEETEYAEKPDNYAYDRSKARGQQAILEVVEKGLDAVVVNPTGVIGVHDYKPSRMGLFFLKLHNGRLPAIVAGGFNFVDVQDVVEGALLAEEKAKTGASYILSGHYNTVKQMADLWAEVAGCNRPRLTTPMWLARLAAPFAESWARVRGAEPLFTRESLGALRANPVHSHEKATRELGYRSRPMRETLENLHDWLMETGRTT
jgi:dihydroflavonol-4-reductase